MRIVYAAIVLPCLVGSAAAQPQASAFEVDLPYSACGSMAPLRANLTGSPDRSPRSDAVLHRLGVRCIGLVEPRVRSHYCADAQECRGDHLQTKKTEPGGG